MQYGAVTVGRWSDEAAAGCGAQQPCPAALEARFDPALGGSWFACFGLGALLATATATVAALAHAPDGARELRPQLRFDRRVVGPGTLAGLAWCAGNFFNTQAVSRGGNALVMAQINGVQLCVSGAWGVCWYGELRGAAAVRWAGFAALTLVAVGLLGAEKG
jgi:glucose uptake protein GlcU